MHKQYFVQTHTKGESIFQVLEHFYKEMVNMLLAYFIMAAVKEEVSCNFRFIPNFKSGLNVKFLTRGGEIKIKVWESLKYLFTCDEMNTQ